MLLHLRRAMARLVKSIMSDVEGSATTKSSMQRLSRLKSCMFDKSFHFILNEKKYNIPNV